MAYMDTTYVDNLITSALRQKLAPTVDVFNALLAAAEAVVDSSLEHAGYQPGLTGTIPQGVKLATLGAWIDAAYGAQMLEAPGSLQMFVAIPGMIREGTFPIPELTPSAAAAVGGVLFSESDASIDTATPQVFGQNFLRWIP